MLRFPPFAGKLPGKGLAFAIHLFLSLLAFSTLVIVMMLFWFPGELFIVDGGLEGLKLVAMVDLVLGPALTLLLYKPGKPRLLFDLSCIAAVQLSALAYGFYATYTQRTVAVVFAENSFTTLSAQDHKLANAELAALDREPGSIPPAGLFKVPMVAVPQPGNYGDYLQDLLNGYPELRERSDLYQPLNVQIAAMAESRQTPEQLEALQLLGTVRQSLSRLKLDFEAVHVYPYMTRFSSGVAVFEPDSQQIVDYIPHVTSANSGKAVANSE